MFQIMRFPTLLRGEQSEALRIDQEGRIRIPFTLLGRCVRHGQGTHQGHFGCRPIVENDS